MLRQMLRTLLLLALLLGPCLAAASETTPGRLTLAFTGKDMANKLVYLTVTAAADSFPSGEAVFKKTVRAEGDELEVSLPPLPPGAYAVTSFCDVNGNGQLDTNLVGKPTEPYGFSRNARGRFGPPDWDDAAFDLGEDDLRLEISLH